MISVRYNKAEMLWKYAQSTLGTVMQRLLHSHSSEQGVASSSLSSLFSKFIIVFVSLTTIGQRIVYFYIFIV